MDDRFMRLANAIRWSFLSELASKTIQPIIFIVLARLLSPEDFGVMSAALMVIGFSQVFWEAGMGKALIQRQTDIDAAANVAFWINLALGGIIATALYLMAGWIASTFFQDERVTLVLQVMTLQVVFGAFAAVHTALLQKEMGFKPLFWVRFATVSLPGLASIPLAWKGMGYWALVTGTLIGQLVQVMMLWKVSAWRPRWSFNSKVAKELGAFGFWVGVSGLLAWFYIWADSLIVGMYLGSRELGLYQTGNQFSSMIFAIIFGPIIPVLYSHLSRMRQDLIRMREAAQCVIKAIAFVSIPIAMIVSSLAGPLTTTLFGQKWQGIEVVVGVMTLMHGFAWIVGMNGELYRAMGRPSAEAVVLAAPLLIYVGTYLYSIRLGLDIFVWARFGLALGGGVLHLFVLRVIFCIPIFPIIRYILLIVAICAMSILGVRYLLIEHLRNSCWQWLSGAMLNLVLVGAALIALERNGMLKTLNSLFKDGEP